MKQVMRALAIGVGGVVLPVLGDCPGAREIPFGQYMYEMFVQFIWHLGLSTLRGIAGLLWFANKVVLFLFGKVSQANFILDIRDRLMDMLYSEMPGILRQVIYQGGGEGIGLFYVALLFAGILMTVSFIGQYRLVRLDRALLWGVLVFALFVSGSTGYDIIRLIENMRLRMLQFVMGTPADVARIVTTPYKATPSEVRDLTGGLPQAFAETYFPQPLEVEAVKGMLVGLPGSPGACGELETKDSLTERSKRALLGVLVAVTSLTATFLILILTITLAALVFVSFGLVLFFLASLPLGFFEFGAQLLLYIVRQYMKSFALTLMIGILIRTMSVWAGWFDFPADISGQAAMEQTWLAVLYISPFAFLIWMITKAVFRLLSTGEAGYREALATVVTWGVLPSGGSKPGLSLVPEVAATTMVQSLALTGMSWASQKAEGSSDSNTTNWIVIWPGSSTSSSSPSSSTKAVMARGDVWKQKRSRRA